MGFLKLLFFTYLVRGIRCCGLLLPIWQSMLLVLRVGVRGGPGPSRCPYQRSSGRVSTQVWRPMRGRGTVMWGSDGSIGGGSTVPRRTCLLRRWGLPVRRRFRRTRVSARLGRWAWWRSVSRWWPQGRHAVLLGKPVSRVCSIRHLQF